MKLVRSQATISDNSTTQMTTAATGKWVAQAPGSREPRAHGALARRWRPRPKTTASTPMVTTARRIPPWAPGASRDCAPSHHEMAASEASRTDPARMRARASDRRGASGGGRGLIRQAYEEAGDRHGANELRSL